MEQSRKLFARALEVIPGGVNSPVRAFGAVGGQPFFAARGAGQYLYDVDDRQLLDYVQSWGASILGHAHPVVIDAIQRAATNGTSFGIPTEREVLLAEAVAARVPSVEMVRCTSSGTEAAMTAVRLARGVTGRNRVIKFAGNYHGHLDALLVAAGSGLATFGLPGSAGVTPGAVADTIVVPYNDLDALDAVLAEHSTDIAAILVEPVAANMGLVPPLPGFLEGLRERCDLMGALLVFDEVITGFRLGISGAQGLYGIRPDVSVFGKIVGGGLPLACVGASRTVMEFLAPVGPVYQAGTLAGNPLATAAGLAVLQLLDDALYTDIERRVDRLATGLRNAAEFAGVDLHVPVVGTLMGLFFTSEPITNYDQAQALDRDRYARFFHGMLEQGVYLAPSGFETTFVSAAHTDDNIEATIDAAARVFATLG
jgi:glutamate-1-semialdehyde 2,1-aminomutase